MYIYSLFTKWKLDHIDTKIWNDSETNNFFTNLFIGYLVSPSKQLKSKSLKLHSYWVSILTKKQQKKIFLTI